MDKKKFLKIVRESFGYFEKDNYENLREFFISEDIDSETGIYLDILIKFIDEDYSLIDLINGKFLDKE